MTTQKELERKLSMMAAPPPPPGLAARLKRDIPPNLELQPRPRRRLAPGWPTVLVRLAAMVVLAAGVGTLGYRYLSTMPTAAPHSLAGTNMSPRAPHWNSYEVARRYLTRGDIPPAAAINLNDLMDTFTYADPLRDSSILYAEATQNPFVSEPRSYLLLVGARNTPAAAESRVTVAFDDLRVDSHAPISGREAELYAVRLGEGLKADDVVARLTLEDNAAEVRTVRRRDLDSGWDRAPRGVKLAVVVAMWGEVLKQTDTGRRIDVNALSARAAEVSRQFQQDARIHELARLIETTRRLQGVS